MHRNTNRNGFTIPEVIIAGTIMIILCVGTLTAYSFAIKINRGNNLRMQALSALQAEVELYRSIKFVPDILVSDPLLAEGTHSLGTTTTADGRVFTLSSTVSNLPAGTTDSNCKFKQITITAAPTVAETEAWLANLNTQVSLQRVRSN